MKTMIIVMIFIDESEDDEFDKDGAIYDGDV